MFSWTPTDARSANRVIRPDSLLLGAAAALEYALEIMSRHNEETSAGLYVVDGLGAAPQAKEDSEEGATRTMRVARACRSSWRLNMFALTRAVRGWTGTAQ